MSFSQAVEKNFDNNTSLIHSLSLNFIFERYFRKNGDGKHGSKYITAGFRFWFLYFDYNSII